MEATLSNAPRSSLPVVTPSRTRRGFGIALTALPIAFLVFDAVMKLVKPAFVTEATEKLGFSPDTIRPLGCVLLTSVVLYALPRTAVLGAVLLTGYLGGAVATHVRAGDPLFSHVLFPVYVALLAWGGLFLRDPTVRALSPWNRSSK
jgi:hypothetical protein